MAWYLKIPFSEVSTTGITQLELTSKAGFAISFYVLVLRNITAAIPEATAAMFVGYYVAVPLTLA